METSLAPILEMNGIGKRFPGVVALSGALLEVYLGELVALIGENGAGKFALMKILGGVLRPVRWHDLLPRKRGGQSMAARGERAGHRVYTSGTERPEQSVRPSPVCNSTPGFILMRASPARASRLTNPDPASALSRSTSRTRPTSLVSPRPSCERGRLSFDDRLQVFRAPGQGMFVRFTQTLKPGAEIHS